MTHSPEIRQFIREQSELFWYIREDRKQEVSIDFLVETILIYGDVPDVRRLVELIGITEVAAVFFKLVESNRNNFPLRTAIFFKNLFQNHVPGNTI